mmetsp:Transcript_42670/g.89517  ORF Transcript_42670/g.89517 Transcript_42670/m.89517 type:complete len:211 (-) Transcript_42670:1292-1924(-)
MVGYLFQRSIHSHIGYCRYAIGTNFRTPDRWTPPWPRLRRRESPGEWASPQEAWELPRTQTASGTRIRRSNSKTCRGDTVRRRRCKSEPRRRSVPVAAPTERNSWRQRSRHSRCSRRRLVCSGKRSTRTGNFRSRMTRTDTDRPRRCTSAHSRTRIAAHLCSGRSNFEAAPPRHRRCHHSQRQGGCRSTCSIRPTRKRASVMVAMSLDSL